jgi:DNA-binding protein H-NS
MATIQELLSQKEQLSQQVAAIDAQITEHREAARRDVVDKMKAQIAELAITPQELFSSRAHKAPTKNVRGKAPIKYRDPASGSAWSGRGIKPRWLTAALSAGKKIEDFVVS